MRLEGNLNNLDAYHRREVYSVKSRNPGRRYPCILSLRVSGGRSPGARMDPPAIVARYRFHSRYGQGPGSIPGRVISL